MKAVYTRKFPSLEAAQSYLKERGRLEYFGREGRYAEVYIYLLHLPDGRKYHVNVSNEGKVEVME